MLERFIRLGALVAAGVVTYFGMLLLLGFRLKDFARKAIM
jgi:putative peptidoglycan lipid II flippase